LPEAIFRLRGTGVSRRGSARCNYSGKVESVDLRGLAEVAMMQPTEHRPRHDLPDVGSFDSPTIRGVFADPQVGP
jgi:hypothetical protein